MYGHRYGSMGGSYGSGGGSRFANKWGKPAAQTTAGSATTATRTKTRAAAAPPLLPAKPRTNYGLQFSGQTKPTKAPDSIDNIATFFGGGGNGGKFTRPKLDVQAPTGETSLKRGTRVKHPKYGDGTVVSREGDGPDAKLTVQFTRHGVKKLVEKFAQLERL